MVGGEIGFVEGPRREVLERLEKEKNGELGLKVVTPGIPFNPDVTFYLPALFTPSLRIIGMYAQAGSLSKRSPV